VHLHCVRAVLDSGGTRGEQVRRHFAVRIDDDDGVRKAADSAGDKRVLKRIAFAAQTDIVALEHFGAGDTRERSRFIRAVVGHHHDAKGAARPVAAVQTAYHSADRGFLVVGGDDHVEAQRSRPRRRHTRLAREQRQQ
jgi:hypothetical protein